MYFYHTAEVNTKNEKKEKKEEKKRRKYISTKY